MTTTANVASYFINFGVIVVHTEQILTDPRLSLSLFSR